MFDWKITVEQIGKQDSLPSPRLCAGIGNPPLESITTLEEYDEYLSKKILPNFDIDNINKKFLGTKNIKLYSGMKKRMTEEELERFTLMQMCTFPEELNSL